MRLNSRTCVKLAAFWTSAMVAGSALSELLEGAEISKEAHVAAERGLSFLQTDAATWRKEHKCATCHHGAMTLWALAEAKSLGYDINEETFTDTAKWTKERLARVDQPRDPRPGWSLVNTQALYLSMMALTVTTQDAVTPDELKRIAGHLLRHQEKDGSWAWSSAPAQNRPPPVFESDEVATLLGYLALGLHVGADQKEKSDVRDSRQNALVWLAKTKPTDTTQAAALRLLVKVQDREPDRTVQKEINQVLVRQNNDGGWGQIKDAASDAYATGQALYVLNLAGVPNDRPEIRRAVSFLIQTQNEDGSWTMKRRSHEGVTPSENVVPITYFGSAWGTLGVMRSISK